MTNFYNILSFEITNTKLPKGCLLYISYVLDKHAMKSRRLQSPELYFNNYYPVRLPTAVILPTAWFYLQRRFKASAYMLGILISSFSLSSLISGPVMGRYSQPLFIGDGATKGYNFMYA